MLDALKKNDRVETIGGLRGVVIVADGSEEARQKLERVLWNDPASGVMRHADAGYEIAIETAREQHLKLPSLGDAS